jgi:hypothetical protein
MKKETIEEVAAKKYPLKGELEVHFYMVRRHAFIDGAKWLADQYDWKSVSESTPPSNVELLVKSPEGIVHLSNWREGYNIFTCQAKSESSSDWKWKIID